MAGASEREAGSSEREARASEREAAPIKEVPRPLKERSRTARYIASYPYLSQSFDIGLLKKPLFVHSKFEQIATNRQIQQNRNKKNSIDLFIKIGLL